MRFMPGLWQRERQGTADEERINFDNQDSDFGGSVYFHNPVWPDTARDGDGGNG